MPDAAHLYACVVCQRRKIKCDRQSPCSNCFKASSECIYRVPPPPRRRKKRSPLGALVARLKRYEELLKESGVNLDAVKAELDEDVAVDRLLDTQTASTNSASDVTPETSTRYETSGKLLIDGNESKYLDNVLWTQISKEVRALDGKAYVQFDSPQELFEGEDTDLTDQEVNDYLILGMQPPAQNLLEVVSPATVDKLWRYFQRNVDPLTKLIHAPSFDIVVKQAIHGSVSRPAEALILSICTCTVYSLTEPESHQLFQEPKQQVLSHYQAATRRILVAAGFSSSTNMMLLQAFVFYLLSIRQSVHPQSLWCLASTALRIGQCVGLHRDGEEFGLSPFDVEYRRRLWAHIAIIDSQAAQLCGSGSSVSPQYWNSSPPTNTNDSDLTPGMQHKPISRIGATDMMFCRFRYEIGQFLIQFNSKSTYDGTWQALSNPSVPFSEKEAAIDRLESKMEDECFKFCDPLVPLHIITASAGRSTIAKLRFLASRPLLQSSDISSQRSQDLFLNSLKIVEYGNLTFSSTLVQRFTWHMQNQVQWDVLVHLLTDLHHRTTGSQVDRAWEQIAAALELRPELVSPKKPLHIAVAKLALKAWAAYERDNNAPLEPPVLSTIRANLAPKHQLASATLSSNFDSAMASSAFDPFLPADDLEFMALDWSKWDELVKL